MGILEKVTPQPVKDKVVRGIEAVVPEQYRNRIADANTVGAAALSFTGIMARHRFPALANSARGLGQLGDDTDGSAAEKWGSSAVGKILDYSLDKAKMAGEVYVLWKDAVDPSVRGLTSRQKIAAFIAAKHITNAALNAATVALKGEEDRMLFGQINMWVDGGTVTSFAFADGFEHHGHEMTAATFNALGKGLAVVGVGTGVLAGVQYGARLAQTIRDRRTGPEAATIEIDDIAEDSVVD